MSTFTKTLNVTPSSLPQTDTLKLAPLQQDGSTPGTIPSGDVPQWTSPQNADPTVMSVGTPPADGSSLPVTYLKPGTTEVDVACDGITTKVTVRVNPTFFELDVHSSQPASLVQESALTASQ